MKITRLGNKWLNLVISMYIVYSKTSEVDDCLFSSKADIHVFRPMSSQ